MPKLAISADFLTALAKIPQAQQKKVRSFITRFGNDPTAPSINYEPIHDMRDPRVRTVRIDLAYRAIVLHPTKGDLYLLMWVDHHDEAMAWARNKRFEVNPVTGAFQILDTEWIMAATAAVEQGTHATTTAEQAPVAKGLDAYTLFETFSDADLLRTGLPALLLPTIRALHKPEELDALRPYLPEEAYEALYWIANLGYSVEQALAEVTRPTMQLVIDPEDVATALTRPDSRRRFALVESDEELQEMLNAPLAKWRIFLHPSQAALVRRTFKGPARVLGGAGTGKTVVAMHRARYLAKEVYTGPHDRILFTTFTRNLATNISQNLANLCGPELARIEVVNLHRWASQFLRSQGIRLEIANDDEINRCWQEAILQSGLTTWPEAFYRSEWEQVVQAQSLADKAAYLQAPRTGRSTRLSRPQRAAIWDIFMAYRQGLAALGKTEWFDLFQQTRLYLAQQGAILPYRAIIVDETQDLYAEELRLLRQMIAPGDNDLFFVGDAHQRIYGRPVVMGSCGINIRGRSNKLRINYRTTEEIRNWAVRLLTGQPIDDLDGGTDNEQEYLSLLHGKPPTLQHFASLDEEIDYLIPEIWRLAEHSTYEHVCLVARTHQQLTADYIPALAQAGVPYLYLQGDTPDSNAKGVRVATMHRVKGLEFTHMLIAGANDGIIPATRHSQDLDEVAQGEHELQERCLLHVAASRARESLTISSYGKPSTLITSGK
jgi:hypothetical protein